MNVIYIIHKVIKYMLPQWAIMIIFYPVKRKSLFNDANVEDTLSWMDQPVSCERGRSRERLDIM